MTLVEQAIEVAAAPSQPNDEVRADGLRESSEGSDLESLDPSSFRERHEILADIRTLADVSLAPAESMPERAKGTADPHRIHRAIILDTACLRVIQVRLAVARSGR